MTRLSTRRAWSRVLIATISILGMWSCGVTRHTPEGEYFLQRVVVNEDESVPKDVMIPAYDLERYIRQSPNKKILGSSFYVWVYNMANPDKDNWWNRLKRKIGEEPVYYDQSSTLKSVENLKIYLNSQGYYSSSAGYSVDTISKPKRAIVTYDVKQGRPYIIDNVAYTFRDSSLRTLIMRDTAQSLIHHGDIFSVTLLDKERERVAGYLRERGYYNFTVNNIEYEADTLMGANRVDVNLIVKQFLDGYDSQGSPVFKDNVRYRVDEVSIYSDFDPTVLVNDTMFINRLDTTWWRGLNIVHLKGESPNVRDKVLRQAVSIYPRSNYNAQSVNQTYQNLMSIGYFKSARVNFSELPAPLPPRDSLRWSRREESAVKSEENEGEKNTSPVGYLSSQILCTPSLKQSFNVELEGSTTSSFYGLSATVGYQNRNIFKGAETFNVDFLVGYEHMKAPDAVKKQATEFGVTMSLSVPRFVMPIFNSHFPSASRPRTKLEMSVNWQNRPYYERVLSSVNLSYSWMTKKYSSFTLRPIDINLIDMKYIDADYYDQLENEYLKNSYQTQLVIGLNAGYVYNNQGRNPNGHATQLRWNVEVAGSAINGMMKLFDAAKSDEGYYELFGIQYAQYFRTDVSVSRKIAFGENSAIAGRLFAGVGVPYGNSTALPFDRLFYAGGSNSMRGWTPRTLGPGSSELPEDMVYPTQLGDIKLEANLEYRFPIWGIVHGATFLDVGNVWYMRNEQTSYDEEAIFSFSEFYKQLGFNTGLGLRFDVQFVVLRLDWGIQLHNPNWDAGSRWIDSFDLSNTAINFGVGYPF